MLRVLGVHEGVVVKRVGLVLQGLGCKGLGFKSFKG